VSSWFRKSQLCFIDRQNASITGARLSRGRRQVPTGRVYGYVRRFKLSVTSSMSTQLPPDSKQVESIRRLGSSAFNYSFGYVANVSLVVWLASHAWHHGRLDFSRPEFALLALVGLLSWTLSEYLLHRYVYHAWTSFRSVGHALHHRRFDPPS
jgi:hypothetical protein